MADQQEWSQEAYERTITSRCWWHTPFDAGWGRSAEYGIDLATDAEVKAIVAMEAALGEVPLWAERVARGAINLLPPCGHYLFPQPYLEALTAIGTEQPPAFLHTCYTADRDRRARLLDYVYCLDAWLAGATPELAAQELTARRPGLAPWDRVCAALWQTLGERTDTKELLVARLLHRERWWAKTLIWDDDAGDVFVTDHYLGDPRAAATRRCRSCCTAKTPTPTRPRPRAGGRTSPRLYAATGKPGPPPAGEGRKSPAAWARPPQRNAG